MDDENSSESFNKFLRDAIIKKRQDSASIHSNAIKPDWSSVVNFEELDKTDRREEAKATVAPSVEANGKPSSMELIKSIAFNGREVRLVGADQKEVEMKDDIPTKVVIALENLQKEASDVWSVVNKQLDKGWSVVNEKLDQGWTELKSVVDAAIAPKSRKYSP